MELQVTIIQADWKSFKTHIDKRGRWWLISEGWRGGKCLPAATVPTTLFCQKPKPGGPVLCQAEETVWKQAEKYLKNEEKKPTALIKTRRTEMTWKLRYLFSFFLPLWNKPGISRWRICYDKRWAATPVRRNQSHFTINTVKYVHPPVYPGLEPTPKAPNPGGTRPAPPRPSVRKA